MDLQQRKQRIEELGYDPKTLSDVEIMRIKPEKLAKFNEDVIPGFEGRTTIKNFGDESSSKALEYAKIQNPELDVIQKEGRIFAKPKGSIDYNAMDPSGFDWRDITDSLYDVGSSVASSAAGIAAGLPTAFTASAPVAAASGYGLAKGREAIGESMGVRDPKEGSSAMMEGAISGAIPALGTLARGAGSIAVRTPIIKNSLEALSGVPTEVYKRYIEDRTFRPAVQAIIKSGDKMTDTAKSVVKPVSTAMNQTVTNAGKAIRAALGVVDDKIAAATGVSKHVPTTSLYDVIADKLQNIPKDAADTANLEKTQKAVMEFVDDFYMQKSGQGSKPFEAMDLKQLQDLKERARTAIQWDKNPSDIPPGAKREISDIAKAVETEITRIQDEAAKSVGESVAPLREAYHGTLKKRDRISGIEGDRPFSSISNLYTSAKTDVKGDIEDIIKSLPKKEQKGVRKAIDTIVAARTAEQPKALSNIQNFAKATVMNPALVDTISSIGTSRPGTFLRSALMQGATQIPLREGSRKRR